jgi:hypothetical protein
VLAYFDAAGQNATPTDSARAMETRGRLATYDPDLYALVNETMADELCDDWSFPPFECKVEFVAKNT